MKFKYALLASLIVSCANATLIHTVDFETENHGYIPSTVWNTTDSGSISDYFMRAQNLDSTGMVSFNNIQGSYFWAMEDTDNLLPNVPNITTTAIDITGYSSFTTTVSFAVDDGGSSTFTPNDDYIDFEYSIDGGNFVKFGSLLVNTFSWELLKDTNVDGVGDEASGINSTFSDVSFAFAGTGNTLQFRVSSFIAGSDEMGMDNIRVVGAIPEPSAMALIGSASLIVLVTRRLGNKI